MTGEAVACAEICAFLGVEPIAANSRISRVSSPRNASGDALVFASGEDALALALESGAGMILANTAHVDRRVAVVPDPRQAFARVYGRWFRQDAQPGIHPRAVVEDGASLGAGCRVEAGAYVASGVEMGESCWIGPNAVLLQGTCLGARVRVQAGAILGADGFGYVEGPDGFLQFPQIGRLEIGDDVEIGAGTTIDRGALETTRIGRGTKIDNLVHIAHNCQVGEDVLIAAQAGIAGSSVIGDRAVLGGQVGIAEHVTLGAGVVLGAQAGVPTHKRLEGRQQIFWGTPARPIAQYLRELARMKRSR